MVLDFDPVPSGLTAAQTKACVKGDWADAASNRFKFFGCDAIRILDY